MFEFRHMANVALTSPRLSTVALATTAQRQEQNLGSGPKADLRI
jgi:hypothetical protein